MKAGVLREKFSANALAAQASVSRILYATARDGTLRAVLARVHPRDRTPYVSTLLVAGISLGVAVLCASHLDDLTRVVNLGALSGFLLLHVAMIHDYVIRGRSRESLTHLAMPLPGLAVIGYVLYEMDSAAKIMGAVWIALRLVYFAVHTIILKRPAAIDL